MIPHTSPDPGSDTAGTGTASPDAGRRTGYLRDPVCGMLVDRGPRTALLEYDGCFFAFCSKVCRSRFARHPERFAYSHAQPAPATVSSGLPHLVRYCPECAAQVRVPFEPTAMLGLRTIDEIETVAWHRWNRRAPRSAGRRDDSSSLIRSLIVLGLEPTSPIRQVVASFELDRHLGHLTDACLHPREMRDAMNELSRALGATLTDSRLSRAALAAFMQPINELLADGIRRHVRAP